MRKHAFTLVELLVVIGIIAVLIGILLPVLSGARRAADAAKCAAGLREIGNAFRMYSIDSKGWYPPSQLQPGSGRTYQIDDVIYPVDSNGTLYNAFWYNFLQKYVTKGKVGGAVVQSFDAGNAQKTIFWGCPSWTGYLSGTAAGGTNVVQLGYGMSYWPTASASNPRFGSFPASAENSFIQNWGTVSQTGRWHREKTWGREGSRRIIVADSRFWSVESQPSSATNFPAAQPALVNSAAVGVYTSTGNQTMVHVYRHGKQPPMHPSVPNTLNARGGKVSYNCLFADGHVTTENSQKMAYEGLRLRFPG